MVAVVNAAGTQRGLGEREFVSWILLVCSDFGAGIRP